MFKIIILIMAVPKEKHQYPKNRRSHHKLSSVNITEDKKAVNINYAPH